MSAEQFPEVNGDESKLVPSQNAPRAEWPKKLRSLSAAELDRLTIDADGRFYWDGRPVNHREPEAGKPAGAPPDPITAENREQAALDMLDRAAHEITEGSSGPPKPQEPRAADPAPAADQPSAEPVPLSALVASAAPEPEVRVVQESAIEALPVAPAVAAPARPRLTLSGWQSAGVVIAILALLVAAAGLAAQGLVAAHEWSCRNGLAQAYCPKPPPAPAPLAAPPRLDFPA